MISYEGKKKIGGGEKGGSSPRSNPLKSFVPSLCDGSEWEKNVNAEKFEIGKSFFSSFLLGASSLLPPPLFPSSSSENNF